MLSLVSIGSSAGDLRSECSADATVVAKLPGGLPVDLRFAVADGSDCYKISAVFEGKRVEGYVPGWLLKGIDQFERERRLAPASTAVVQAEKVIARPASKPAKADPGALYQAGLAAYKDDQIRPALDYWKQSLELRPDEELARLYHRVEREAASDMPGEKLYGARVALRYEKNALSPESAATMLATLDEELTRVWTALGCAAQERVTAVVQSREAYLRATDAAEWSGAQYDGRIRISMPGGNRRVVAHELVHACLANLSNGWPAWLHEGLARKLSGDTLLGTDRDRIREMAVSRSIPRLEHMGQTWSRMDARHARIAYDVALAAVDLLFAQYGDIRNVLANPYNIPAITADLDHRLGL